MGCGCLQLACSGTLLQSQEVKLLVHPEHTHCGYTGSPGEPRPWPKLVVHPHLEAPSLSFLSADLAPNSSSPYGSKPSHTGWPAHVTAD